MAEAGYADGFDAGPAIHCDSSYANVGRGLRQQFRGRSASALQLQPIERAGFFAGYAGKKYRRGVIQRGERRVWQRRDPDGLVCRQGRRLHLWQLPRHRRALSRSRPTNSTRRSAARSSPRCSSWSTRRRCTRRSGSSAFSTAPGRGSANPRSGDPGLRLHRALRGHHDQRRLTPSSLGDLARQHISRIP